MIGEAVVAMFALKLMFVKEIVERDSVAVIRFDGGQEGQLRTDNKEKYAKLLETARKSRTNRRPVAVTMAKPNDIVEMVSADVDTVKNVEERDAATLQVLFQGHAAVYELEKDHPDLNRIRAVLEQSSKDKSRVWLRTKVLQTAN